MGGGILARIWAAAAGIAMLAAVVYISVLRVDNRQLRAEVALAQARDGAAEVAQVKCADDVFAANQAIGEIKAASVAAQRRLDTAAARILRITESYQRLGDAIAATRTSGASCAAIEAATDDFLRQLTEAGYGQ